MDRTMVANQDVQGLQWDDALLTGDNTIDEDHRVLVELIERLQACPPADRAPLLAEFGRHAREHFDREDRLMQGTDFPAADCHVAEHRAVLASVTEVQAELDAGNFRNAIRLVDELAKWFPPHVQHLDSAVAQWLANRRHGGKPIVLRRFSRD
jgi:hemerythrin